jgi:elongation factor 1-beta
MASVIIALKVMPDSPEADLAKIEKEVSAVITKHHGKVVKHEITPVAFGLKSVTVHFVIKEELGSTEPMETEIASLPHINSAEVVDVRRAVG